MQSRGLMTYKNSFSRLSYKVKKSFFSNFFSCKVLSQSSQLEQQFFFYLFGKIHLPGYLKKMVD